MRKTIIGFIITGFVIIIAAWLVLNSCNKNKNEPDDKPGYIPPDLTYETDEKLPEGNDPETDVPEGSKETGPQHGQVTPDTNKPDTSTPETEAPETDPVEITPPDTTPEETTPVDTTPADTTNSETTAPDTNDDWFEGWGTETPVPETDPPETEAPYYPDIAPIPDHIKYVMVDTKVYRSFVEYPNDDIVDGGYNSYNMLDDGTFFMRQITNSGFERYVGEYRGGEMDLSLDIIEFVLSGDMQDMLIENKVNNTILDMCAITRGDSYPRLTAVWIETKDGDYFITYDSNADDGESAFKLYTRKEYLKLID